MMGVLGWGIVRPRRVTPWGDLPSPLPQVGFTPVGRKGVALVKFCARPRATVGAFAPPRCSTLSFRSIRVVSLGLLPFARRRLFRCPVPVPCRRGRPPLLSSRRVARSLVVLAVDDRPGLPDLDSWT